MHWLVWGADSANHVQNQTTLYLHMVRRQRKTDLVNVVIVKNGSPSEWISLTDLWWCNRSGKIPCSIINKGKDATEKIFSFQFNITFPCTRDICWKVPMFSFLYFHNSSNLSLGLTRTCCEEWKNLGVKAMVAEIKLRLATTIIFNTIVGSLVTLKYLFLQLQIRHFISATNLCYWWISAFYRVTKN